MALKLRLVTPTAVGKLKDLLSPGELLIFQKLKSEERRRDWLAGRLAAKELLSAHLQSSGCPVPLGQIELYHRGGPCFRLLGDISYSHQLNISIAHSHGYGLCGLAQTKIDGYIGVDLEKIRPIRRAVQRRFLTRAEMERIKQQFAGVESEGAVLFWALKEAAFKALHHSLQGGRAAASSASLQVMRNTEISLEAGGKAVITYKPTEGLIAKEIVLSAAYRRHADFFLAWALVSPMSATPTDFSEKLIMWERTVNQN